MAEYNGTCLFLFQTLHTRCPSHLHTGPPAMPSCPASLFHSDVESPRNMIGVNEAPRIRGMTVLKFRATLKPTVEIFTKLISVDHWLELSL